MKPTMVLNGKRINWRNCTLLKKEKDNKLIVYYKYKASIKEEKFDTTGLDSLNGYLMKFELINLQEYYININNVLFVKEDINSGKIDTIKIVFTFTDGLSKTFLIDINFWYSWRNNYL